jgi:hypothetical protein
MRPVLSSHPTGLDDRSRRTAGRCRSGPDYYSRTDSHGEIARRYSSCDREACLGGDAGPDCHRDQPRPDMARSSRSRRGYPSRGRAARTLTRRASPLPQFADPAVLRGEAPSLELSARSRCGGRSTESPTRPGRVTRPTPGAVGRSHERGSAAIRRRRRHSDCHWDTRRHAFEASRPCDKCASACLSLVKPHRSPSLGCDQSHDRRQGTPCAGPVVESQSAFPGEHRPAFVGVALDGRCLAAFVGELRRPVRSPVRLRSRQAVLRGISSRFVGVVPGQGVPQARPEHQM